MIIDALTHLHPDPSSFGTQHDLSATFLLQNLQTSPVDRAVVTAIEGETNYCTPTSFVVECCRAHPDHLIGVASVNPLTNPNAVEDLERYITQDGMRGLKLHPRHQKLAADDPRVTPVVEKATELGVPVYICGSQWKRAPLRDQMPLNIDFLCKRVPEAKIVVAHSGGFRFMDAFVLAVANDNIFLETSIALKYFHETPFEEQYMFTLRQLGARRIVFGSDHPEDPSKMCYERSMEILRKHGFSGEEIELIAGENIRALMGI